VMVLFVSRSIVARRRQDSSIPENREEVVLETDDGAEIAENREEGANELRGDGDESVGLVRAIGMGRVKDVIPGDGLESC